MVTALDEVRAAAALPAEMLRPAATLENQGKRGAMHAARHAGLGVIRAEIGDVRSFPPIMGLVLGPAVLSFAKLAVGQGSDFLE